MSNSPSTTTGRRAGARRGSLARSSDRARTTRARGRRGASDRGRGRAGAWTRRAGRRSVTSPRRGRRTDFERAAPHLHFLFSSGSARWREFFSRRGRTRTRGERRARRGEARTRSSRAKWERRVRWIHTRATVRRLGRARGGEIDEGRTRGGGRREGGDGTTRGRVGELGVEPFDDLLIAL